MEEEIRRVRCVDCKYHKVKGDSTLRDLFGMGVAPVCKFAEDCYNNDIHREVSIKIRKYYEDKI